MAKIRLPAGRFLLIAGGTLCLTVIAALTWVLTRDDNGPVAAQLTQAASAAPAKVAESGTLPVAPQSSAAQASTSRAAAEPASILTAPQTGPEPAVLKEIPAARRICANLARHDAASCSRLENNANTGRLQLCQQSARLRLEACNAGIGLPLLNFTP